MPSILDKYQTNAPLSYTERPGQAANVGATKQSKLHAFGTTAGYSIEGAYNTETTKAYNSYNDGTNNILPRPSNLDLKGQIPPNSYANNPPEKGITKRIVDLTPPPGR